jgi:transglutaminase-like putative cysteine protease
VWEQGVGLLEAVLAASVWVADELRYVYAETPSSSLGRVLAQGAGDCWDFAHLLISVVRRWGVPARLVTGYVDSGYDSSEMPCRLGLHAWTDVLIPGGGWRGIDPTHGLVANDTYVPVALGRDGLDVPPWRSSDANGRPELGVHRVRHI